MTMFRDERGKASFMRTFLAAWSAFAMGAIIVWHGNPNLGVILTFISAVVVPAVLIVGGKSAMQYLGGQAAGRPLTSTSANRPALSSSRLLNRSSVRQRSGTGDGSTLT